MDIQALVDEYNAAEKQQGERLTRLYGLMRARSANGGDHEVKFGPARAWDINFLRQNDPQFVRHIVDGLAQPITSWR